VINLVEVFNEELKELSRNSPAVDPSFNQKIADVRDGYIDKLTAAGHGVRREKTYE